MPKKFSSLIAILLFFSLAITAQNQVSKPKVFFDCQTNCYLFFVKQDVEFIDYVRDRQVADLFILVTDQNASAGAREIQMLFTDLQSDGLRNDTIKYYRPANVSDLEERNLFIKNLKKGLLPYLVGTSVMDHIEYTVKGMGNESDSLTTMNDPWNYWSFNVGLNLYVNGEDSFTEQGYFGRVSASRVTEKHKLFLTAFYDYDKSKFTLSDGEVVESSNERNRTFAQMVWSISPHWSAGVRSVAGSSTFGNTDFESAVKPAIEYNVYPYQDNSTRRFSFLYSAGIAYKDYTEVTIFEKLSETLPQHGMDIEFSQTKQWGNISLDMEFDQYLHNLSFYSLSINPNIELNLVKGLSLEFGGEVSWVNDRINISKADISDQDIILQNKQLDTNFSYFSYFGFNYRFGSQNNNIVNPRF